MNENNWRKSTKYWWFHKLLGGHSRWISVWPSTCEWGIYDQRDDLTPVAFGTSESPEAACNDSMEKAISMGYKPI